MTLTELLVVLAILGVLLLIAFPVVKPLFSKTYALEAKTNLKHLSELQKVYYLEHMQYGEQFSRVGFEHAKLVHESDGSAHYQIEILRADREGFKARATAVTDFDGDGAMNVWEIDHRGIPQEIIPD